MIPNNILKSKFVAILPTNVKKKYANCQVFYSFSICLCPFWGQKYEKQAINMFSWRTILFSNLNFVENADGTIDTIYDINGRRLQQRERGINIINGKKVITNEK